MNKLWKNNKKPRMGPRLAFSPPRFDGKILRYWKSKRRAAMGQQERRASLPKLVTDRQS